jgi:hypothetical protein
MNEVELGIKIDSEIYNNKFLKVYEFMIMPIITPFRSSLLIFYSISCAVISNG